MSFAEKHITKNNFHIHGGSIIINEVDIGRMELSKKESRDNKGTYKYFIGHIHLSFKCKISAI